MTEEELERLEELCSRATPGPWKVRQEFGRSLTPYGDVFMLCAADLGEEASLNNAAFIVAARTALPALLAEVRRLQAELAKQDTLERRVDELDRRTLSLRVIGGPLNA